MVRRQTRGLAVFAQSGLQCQARGDGLQGSQRANAPFLHLFVWSESPLEWTRPTHLLSSVCQSRCRSLLESPLQTHLERMFNQLSGHPAAKSR